MRPLDSEAQMNIAFCGTWLLLVAVLVWGEERAGKAMREAEAVARSRGCAVVNVSDGRTTLQCGTEPLLEPFIVVNEAAGDWEALVARSGCRLKGRDYAAAVGSRVVVEDWSCPSEGQIRRRVDTRTGVGVRA